MKVIVFAATKGGTGKTTLAYNVALMAAQKYQVFIADLDPQATLTNIWQRRAEMVNPRLLTDIETVSKSVRLLESAGYGRDFLFVDTPNSLNPVIADAIACADVIVLPTQPSLADLEAQQAVAAKIDRLEIASRTIFALNRTSNAADTKKAKAFLAHLAKHEILTVADRADYRRALDTGAAGWEVSGNRDIKGEVKRVWDLIQTVVNQHATRPTEGAAADGKRVH